jgi:hypothetical protein
MSIAAFRDEDWEAPTVIPESTDEPREAMPRSGKPKPAKIKIDRLPPLTLSDWESRDLAPPDFLMGNWLSTTSRVLLSAATGLGKSNFSVALGMRVAAQQDFLHWRARRTDVGASVLFIDGEMPRRLLKERVLAEEERLGMRPAGFMALSREDVPDLQPLNTPLGQAWIDALISKIGSVDLIIFDNIMALLAGDMKDPESWQQTLPWALSLTSRTIGQMWIHHTGHDESRAYGDKSREWQLDTTIHLDSLKRDDTDLSFSMEFKKARERTPSTRFDFQDVRIALTDNQWRYELTDARLPGKISPQTRKALDALRNAIASDHAVSLTGGRRAARREFWRDELALLGLIDPQKPKSADTLFNRWRRELVAANHIACEEELSWLIA